MTSFIIRSRRASRSAKLTLIATVCGAAALIAPIASAAPVEAEAPMSETPESMSSTALEIVNALRNLSGVGPVVLDAGLSAPAVDHACWMVLNDTISHTETPGTLGYSPAGALSAARSNVAVSSSPSATPESFVGLWMTGPYHAAAILDPRLDSVGYGHCSDAAGTWQSAGTLDILGGLGADGGDRVVTFPGDGAVVPWSKFVTESPNPLANCSSGGSSWTTAGLPLFALLPESPLPGATATLTGPAGEPIELCVITQHNDVSDVGRSILSARRAMVAVPRQALADGQHEVTFNTGQRTVSWSFIVDSTAPGPTTTLSTASVPPPVVTELAAPATYVPVGPVRTFDSRNDFGRIDGGREYHLPIGTPPAGATAVLVNITTTETDAAGWVAVYGCGHFAGTSTSNFAPGRTGSTTTVVQLSSGVCVRNEGSTHLIADVTGWMVAGGGGAGFVPGEARAYDSRQVGHKLAAGDRVRVVVAQAGVNAAAMNVTTTDVEEAGFVTVWPCASLNDPVPTVSLGQGRPGPAQAAFGVIPVAADGGVCVFTSSRMHVIVDVAGAFLKGSGSKYVAFPEFRRYDSRLRQSWASPGTPGVRLAATASLPVALAVNGVPQSVEAVMANVTVTSTADSGWLGMKACGNTAETSDLNFAASDTIANMTIIPTEPNSAACAALSASTHLIVDVFGVFVPG
jgi:uncharacterized protein YkwD